MKGKRKSHNKLLQEHSTHSPHSHSIFVNLPKILTPPPPPNHRNIYSSTSNNTRAESFDKSDVSWIGNNTSAIQKFILID